MNGESDPRGVGAGMGGRAYLTRAGAHPGAHGRVSRERNPLRRMHLQARSLVGLTESVQVYICACSCG